MDKLKELFYNPKTGYVSLTTLYQYNKNYNLGLTKKDITDWYHEQHVNQIYKQNNKIVENYNHIVSPLNEPGILQSDLMDLKRFYKNNGGMRYLLNIIDVYSRYAWTFPIPDKRPVSIAPYIETVLKKLNKHFYKTFTVDKGSEYQGEVLEILLKYNTKKYTNDPHSLEAKHITSVVERYNRTLLNKIKKYMTSNDTLNYIDVIDDLVYNYNHSYHSSIKMKPVDKLDEKEIPIHINLDEKEKVDIYDEFSIGDKVRHLKKRKTFDKMGFGPIYSLKIFQITEKKGKRFLLDNGKLYYPQHLLKVNSNDDSLNTYGDKIKQNKKMNKIEVENKKEGIDMTDIITTKRERKRNTKYDNDYI